MQPIPDSTMASPRQGGGRRRAATRVMTAYINFSFVAAALVTCDSVLAAGAPLLFGASSDYTTLLSAVSSPSTGWTAAVAAAAAAVADDDDDNNNGPNADNEDDHDHVPRAVAVDDASATGSTSSPTQPVTLMDSDGSSGWSTTKSGTTAAAAAAAAAVAIDVATRSSSATSGGRPRGRGEKKPPTDDGGDWRVPETYYRGDSANVSRLLDLLLRGYDKRLRPNYGGQQVEVGITMFVSSISHISEVNMDFTLDFYFRQHWTDSRLNFTDSGEDELCISNEMLGQIWWPDTFFANAKMASFHKATTRNAFLRIKPTGMITQSLRLTVTATCSMDLTYFPMDSQICSLEIESYAYSVKHILYNWKDGPTNSVKIDTAVQLPQFRVRGFRAINRTEQLSTGNYSRLACEFYLTRRLGYYIIHIYVPSCLIVVLSWISFWLHRDASPARVALGITTVLTMTTVLSSSNASLPKISYLKSIDIYLVTCFVMVFASLLEYACVSFLGRARSSTSNPGSNAANKSVCSAKRSRQAAPGVNSSSALAYTGCSAARRRWLTGVANTSGTRRRTSATVAHEDHLLSLCDAESAFDHPAIGCDGPHTLSPSTANGSVIPLTQLAIVDARTSSVQTIDGRPSRLIPSNNAGQVVRSSNRRALTVADSDIADAWSSGTTTAAVTSSMCHLHHYHNHELDDFRHRTTREGGSDNNNRNCSRQVPNVGTPLTSLHGIASTGNGNGGSAATAAAATPSATSTRAAVRRSVAMACAIDRYSRLVFPLLFVVFNVVYWLAYLHFSAQHEPHGFVLFE